MYVLFMHFISRRRSLSGESVCRKIMAVDLVLNVEHIKYIVGFIVLILSKIHTIHSLLFLFGAFFSSSIFNRSTTFAYSRRSMSVPVPVQYSGVVVAAAAVTAVPFASFENQFVFLLSNLFSAFIYSFRSLSHLLSVSLSLSPLFSFCWRFFSHSFWFRFCFTLKR